VFILTRTLMDKRGTMGRLTGPNIVEPIYTLEEPWQGNQRQISCIPVGTYLCMPHGWEKGSTKHFKQVWEVTGVKDRTAILIHAGNTLKDTEGCILVGFDAGQFSVGRSRPAIERLRQVIGERPFALTVQEIPHARR
jgi:hypothetical protein